ncbi:hypothetical protein MTR67_000678 [Solanum verrucosum]|uniref:Uncharacterized protein n=1 Tax=Solanum verrucosum TaxID=315347 RepID=A0AAF0PM33_SOLVR|nr:hypothetical protein MTR67_000678 [Solanum verrucosum]
MDSPPENAGKGLKPTISVYTDYLSNRISSYFPAASYSNFLSRISNFYRGSSGTSKRRRRKTSLPLPFPSSAESSTAVCEASRTVGVLEDIMECIFLNMHYIQKNLEYWQSKAQGSNAKRAYFMICERGPYAFFNGTTQLLSDCVGEGSGMQHTYCLASSYISERINFLSSLRYHLATFLAQDINISVKQLLWKAITTEQSEDSKLALENVVENQGICESSLFWLIYMKVDKVGEELVKDSEKSLSSLLVDMNDLFLKLEASIGHFHAVRQQSSSVDESYSFPLIFEKLPEVNQEGSQWTDCETRDAINLIYQNVDRLNTYLAAITVQVSVKDQASWVLGGWVHGPVPGLCKLSRSVDPSMKLASTFQLLSSLPQIPSRPVVPFTVREWVRTNSFLVLISVISIPKPVMILGASEVTIHRKPRRVTRYWIPYTCGIVGISICSLWLLRHSSLVGSSDIDNWIREAKESTVSFWNDHVEQPLISIRDDLFYTFRKRQKGAMEPEEVQLTADSLHRMLQAFTEQTKGEKAPPNATDQEMLEIVMMRYEKELMHPIQNLFSGELSRALLIQVQKLKLDIEEAMLELDQILRANEINFAILAALPAFFLSLIVIMLVRAWFKQDKKAEGRGRVARIQRRLLIVEVERKIMQLESCKEQGQEKDAQCMLGLALYYLDRLYCAVEGHARATGEWISLRQDIIDLAKPDLQTAHKLRITSRMERVYDCLLPLPKTQ